MGKDEKKNRPLKSFKLGGVEVSAWENVRKDGNRNISFTVQKRFKDGDEWKSTTTFYHADLLVLSKLALNASDFASVYDEAQSRERAKDKSSKKKDDEDDDEDDD